MRGGDIDLRERRLDVRAATSKSGEARDVTLHLEAARELDTYINDIREGDNDQDAPLLHRSLRPGTHRQRRPQALRSTQSQHRCQRSLRAYASPHLGDQLPPLRQRQP
jgi:hypothetical protein